MPDLSSIAGEILEGVRARQPRVHCLTNTVAEAFTANVLLAAGAVPSMTANPAEVEAFVEGADGLLVNLGTPDEERNAATGLALDAAQKRDIPWVLDPVLVDRSPLRLARAKKLLDRSPAVVRGNSGEMESLTGGEALEPVVATTGVEDVVVRGRRCIVVRNGHPYMAKVTAMGCAISALIAAFCAVHDDAFEAAAAALLVSGVCGGLAAAEARGPGSFGPWIVDILAGLEVETLAMHAAFEEGERA